MQRLLAAALGLVIAVGITPAYPQSYPNQPIKLIVPFPPGGPIDVMARLVAQKLNAGFGTVMVENRPGGGSTVGLKAVAAAEPDGYHVPVRRHDDAERHPADDARAPRLNCRPGDDTGRAGLGNAIRSDHCATDPGEDRAGIRRLREGKSRQAQLRRPGRRDPVACRRVVQDAGRHWTSRRCPIAVPPTP